MTWTVERVEKFKALHSEGLSFAAIARCLGGFAHTSDQGRSACIGKANRLGMSRPRKVKPHVARERAAKARGFREPIEAPAIAADVPHVEPEPVKFYSTAHLSTLFNLGPRSCRWPCWDDNTPSEQRFYCGTPDADPFGGRPYCGFHAAAAFNPAPERKPRPYHWGDRAA